VTEHLPLLSAALLGYLLGSIPFGLVLTRLCGYGDIRKIGSGNIGATNVLRTGNKPLALAVLLLDSGKGAGAVMLARYLLPELGFGDPIAPIVAGVAAVFGHNFPVWLGFKGGKGIATTLGTLIAIHWPVGLAACATWLVVALIFRFSSLSALLSLVAVPVYAMLPILCGANPPLAWAGVVLAVLGWARHHANIRRLLNGTEPRIGQKK
jgi:glycerol-3-phosphate acyltransferase PlsY